ncbi:hypothetical protein LOD99_5570 [Oopsacas minuta]|uniref:BZIP domain-containing protein n=1 Tax=Oopsacas minuta TaxID=111878 RepID=A0AAV7JQL8_9METZ|nr:hypothetical protein LOD99_5570 [Oopsacas minuta]
MNRVQTEIFMSSKLKNNNLCNSIGIRLKDEDLPINEFHKQIQTMIDENRITDREEANLRLLRAKQVKGRAARSYCERKKTKEVCLEADVRVLRKLRELYIREKKLLRQEIFFISRLLSDNNMTAIRETE